MKHIVMTIVATVIVALVHVTTTYLWMPDQVAQHFTGSGEASGLVSRGSYVLLSMLLLFGMTLIMVLSLTLIPRKFPRLVNIPNQAYWFEAPRRDATISSLQRFCLGIALIVQALILGMHGLLIQANQLTPPRLDSIGFTVAISLFGLAMVVWIIVLWKRFRVMSGA